MDSISKQKKYLSENLIVENLRMYGSNKEDIKEFLQAKSGNILAEYLNNKAWNEIKLTSIGNINVKFEEVFNSHLKQ